MHAWAYDQDISQRIALSGCSVNVPWMRAATCMGDVGVVVRVNCFDCC